MQLVEYVLAGSFLDELPARMIGDKAYDSDKLDQRMRELYDIDIEMIAPNRNRRSRTQDGRKLRRYSRRWRVERLFAWMQNFRRLVTRWEYHIENFLGFVHLACVQMLENRQGDVFFALSRDEPGAGNVHAGGGAGSGWRGLCV